MDKKRNSYIVKIANTADKVQEITLTFKGVKNLKTGKLTTLHAALDAENAVGQSPKVTPEVSTAPSVNESKTTLTIPAKTFAVYEWIK